MSFPAKGFQKDYVPFVDQTDARQLVGRHSEESVDFWRVSRVDELTMPNRVADDQNSLNPTVQLYPEPIRRAVLSVA